jgi:uncharacterized protein YjeT (DUF2065 family)
MLGYGGKMACGVIFGLIFVGSGIYMIRTGKGWRVFSKSHEDVTGAQARGEGILAIIIGVVIVAIFFIGR